MGVNTSARKETGEVVAFDIAHVLAFTQRVIRSNVAEGWIRPDSGRIVQRANERERESFWSFLYDRDADVLYVHRGEPASADNADMTDDDILVQYRTNEPVGFTILHASRREHRLRTAKSVERDVAS